MSNDTTIMSTQKDTLFKQVEGAASLQYGKTNNILSLANVFKSISDDKSLLIFQAIADVNSNTEQISLKKLGLSRKQYYTRISAMIESNLIKRTGGRYYYLTPLGTIVYDRIRIVKNALNDYYNLKAIEAMEGNGFSNEEFTKLVDSLIDNQEIKELVTKKW